MCGRYASVKDPGTLAAEFDAQDQTGADAPGPNHNVAPTDPVFAVVQRHPRDADGHRDMSRTERSLRVMRWGLVPKWAKDPSIGSRMINAKAETVTSKPAFRTAIKHYRCLLPADGWFEWWHDGTGKRPYFMTSDDGSSVALAALWSTWRASDAASDRPLVTCSVLTTDAVGPLVELHERMPLVLPASRWQRWLDPEEPDVSDLLVPPSQEQVAEWEMRPVSTEVNDVRNDGPQLLERVDDRPASSAAVRWDG